MKTDRLLGIIAVLQQKKKVTAPYLAEKFEVSRRTINRDIEDICKAGIPIVTSQGFDGGISIMEGYQLDTTIFTKDELQSIFVGLKSLDSVSQSSISDKLAIKLNAVKQNDELHNDISIDLSSFYRESLVPKIELLKKAIKERTYVRFRYYYNKGEEDKQIEPYVVEYRWSSWYILGYDLKRNDFRTYKLSRLWNLVQTDLTYKPREVPKEKMIYHFEETADYYVSAEYDASIAYRLVEEQGPDCYTVTEDGKLYSRWLFKDREYALSWFLSLGNKVKVIDPPDMVERIKEAIKQTGCLYDI